MSAEREALRALIDALERQETVEGWLRNFSNNRPGDLVLSTECASALAGYRETMRCMAEYINDPDIKDVIVSVTRDRLQEAVDRARLHLAQVQNQKAQP